MALPAHISRHPLFFLLSRKLEKMAAINLGHDEAEEDEAEGGVR